MAEKEEICNNCGAEIKFGKVALPKVKEFVKLTCSECGYMNEVSLLRIYLRRNKEERAVTD